MAEHRSTYQIPELPPPIEFETIAIYKILAEAKAGLAELKGIANAIPNQNILIETLSLQEAKESSEIENIITTQDDLYKSHYKSGEGLTGPAKEVILYRDAIRLGWKHLQESNGLITNRALIHQYQLLKSRMNGFRQNSGTVLKNTSGEIIYVPPQQSENIIRYMTALEMFINNDGDCNLDPLIKMAIIHHQFESIHPFSDGNGRIGRMLNVLYLCKTGYLDIPILYLSRAINSDKVTYYKLLQLIRDSKGSDHIDAWQNWVIFMLNAIVETSNATIELVTNIRQQMADMKIAIRDGHLSKIYSQDLLNNLFHHPYTRVEYLKQDLKVSRPTATNILNRLTEENLLKKTRQGRNNYYVNTKLVGLFLESGQSQST
ncbi:MAG: Fic family protein [bacterium]